ncbi:MAG: GSCFA domain-containing protein [Bacteroidetes bacterium]|nr:GSCFA domain-containing protein [Bacteroidota bacterium]
MHFFLPFDIPNLQPAITYQDKIYLLGSCFTEHMTRFLGNAKFQVAENAHGILFNPISVVKSVQDVIHKKVYTEQDLFSIEEYWHSWYHHSDFSDLSKEIVLRKINKTIEEHHQFLKETKFLIITLGSAFAYKHLEQDIYVSNNHRAPHHWFRKDLLSIDTIKNELLKLQTSLSAFNKGCKIIFTISPVRHSRDGLIENNRSKARLIEAVHSMSDSYYFPSYEIVIDQLRDHRFYDIDLVHPNFAATQFVWEQFMTHCMDSACYPLIKEMEDLSKAMRHKPKSDESLAHQKFLHSYLEKTIALKTRFPHLDLQKEIEYFAKQGR